MYYTSSGVVFGSSAVCGSGTGVTRKAIVADNRSNVRLLAEYFRVNRDNPEMKAQFRYAWNTYRAAVRAANV